MIENEEKLDQIIEDFKTKQGTIIGLMQDINETYRYLPEEALQKVSSELEIPLAKLYTLATFYNSFRLEPVGKHHVCVCMGTACLGPLITVDKEYHGKIDQGKLKKLLKKYQED